MKQPKSFDNFRPHPWHGLQAGPNPPERVYAFVEITPFDVVKYEIDKQSGYIIVDRPQRMSAVPPTIYGFIPQTYCAAHVAALTPGATVGDGDPLDICVFSERPINRGEILVHARVVGGLQMIDGGEADDKIIAILEDDPVWADIDDVSHFPDNLIKRLQHYFSTYKMVPGETSPIDIQRVYDRAHALDVVRASMRDYQETFGD